MSQKGDVTLIVPGATGWEVWEGPPPSGFMRKSALHTEVASEIDGLAGKDVVMFFPVKSLTHMPFKTATGDASLFDDLVAMHIERLGVRIDPMAGQLTDTAVISKDENEAVLASLALKVPTESELPTRSPKEFDSSPRAFITKQDSIALWKEFGRWVFAFYQNQKVFYAQATANDSHDPDDSLVREIRLAAAQFSMQGLSTSPQEIYVWHPDGEIGSAGAMEGAFQMPVTVSRRPDPVMSEIPSKLLPADVHTARREAAKKRQLIVVASAAALLVLGAIGYGSWGLWKEMQITKELQKKADAVKPETLAFNNHTNAWGQLGPIVDERQWPVEILLHITKAIPANSGMRISTAEISPEEVQMKAEVQKLGPEGMFQVNMKKDDFLSRYDFVFSKPTQDATGKWTFSTEGQLPKQTP